MIKAMLFCFLFLLLSGCEEKNASKISIEKAKESCATKASNIWANSGITGASGTPFNQMEVVRFSERDRGNALAYDIKSEYLFDSDAGEYAGKELTYLCSVLIDGDKVEISGDILHWAKENKK